MDSELDLTRSTTYLHILNRCNPLASAAPAFAPATFFGPPSRILTCTELKGHWRLFVLVSVLRVLDKANTQLSSPR